MAVFTFAAYLHSNGYTVEIPPVISSPDPSSNTSYTDSGDLFIIHPGERRRLEVKHRQRDFTCAGDWPDPHIFVSNEGMVNRSGEISAYIILNKPLTHALVIKSSTRPYWYLWDNQPSNTEYPERVYCCPIGYTKWVSL